MSSAAVSVGGAMGSGQATSAGELDAFEAELAPLLRPALQLAAGLRLDRQDAEDAVQEAALRAWRRRGNRKPGTPLRPWFLAIVANQCRDTRRHRWASVLRMAEPREGSSAAGPDRDDAIDVRNALRRLPHDVRAALVLRYFLDLPLEEVARVCACSPDAARSRVRRGVDALSGELARKEVTR